MSLSEMDEYTKERKLLVDGYVKEQECMLNLYSIIPIGINAIILMYQLLLEKWNNKLSNQAFNIVNENTSLELDSCHYEAKTAYGDHIVKYGESFTWFITMLNKEPSSDYNYCMIMGLIPNNKEILENHKSSSGWFRSGGYGLSSPQGLCGINKRVRRYCDKNAFNKTSNEIEMIFNWNEESLHFIINGKDFGNAFELHDNHKLTNDETAEFRFVFCLTKCKNVQITVHGQFG